MLFLSESNLDKKLRGKSSIEALHSVLEIAKKQGHIKSVIPKYSIGKLGYKNKNQFKAHFLIEFEDGIKWILFSTTSIRERVKKQYWEALNFKQLDDSIKAAYLVYPDSIAEKERQTAISKNKKIQSKVEYSTLEGIVSQNELSLLIEEYALKDKSKGHVLDAKGNGFESKVASIISDPANLKKWKSGSEIIEGAHFDIFCSIVKGLNLNKDLVSCIFATSSKKEIGVLPTGGSAKTDVLVTVTCEDRSESLITISCKRTSKTSVSVHQYKADTFADVLDKDNSELRNLLNLFQEKGNQKDMSEKNKARLTELMKPHSKALALWALGGVGGPGVPEKQWAKYILTYDNNDDTVSIHTIEDYYDLLVSSGVNGAFGTLFRWTYQRKRGTNIQLKCKILK